MTPAGWTAAARPIVIEETGSTMDEARIRAADGEAGPLWIMARRQTAGRGRRGRSWEAGAGNLHATLLLRPNVEPAKAATLSFVAALAAHEMFEAFAPGLCRLKWPNDPLLRGRKAAGVLLESAARPDGRLDWLAIGVGANLAWSPEGTPYPVTSLKAEAGAAPAPEDALAVLAAAFEAWFATWEARGMLPVRNAWLDRAYGLGRPISVRLPGESFEAIFEDLDESGALIARLPDGRSRRVEAGEVFPAFP